MEDIKRAFDAGAMQYDLQRKKIIPDLNGFYDAAVWAADWSGESPAILDLGAGTGLLSARLRERYPESRLTLLDISAQMLDIARQRLPDREGIRFCVSDYSREPLEGPYDLIVSALSIHHLARGDKRTLYARIYHALNDKGIFVHAEQVQGETAWTHRRNIEYWDAFIESGDLPKNEREQVRLRRDTYDRMETLSLQLEWMREIGYADVDVVYKNRSFAVFSGRKSPS